MLRPCDMLRHAMVRDKPGGLSLQPPLPQENWQPSENRLLAILVYKCLQMFYICFILRLRESFNSRFQEGFTIHIKKTRTLSIRLLTTSARPGAHQMARLYFHRSPGPLGEEKERGLISRTSASNRAEISFCMHNLPPFQVRPSKSRLFGSQSTD